MFDRVVGRARLMEAMLEHVGARAGDAVRVRQGMAWYEARTRCLACADARRCRDWLDATPAPAPPPAFCPNAPLLRRCLPASCSPADEAIEPMEVSVSVNNSIEALLARIRDWWRMGDELGRIDRQELDRIAHDLGMTADDLRDLAARGPDAAHLLHERMAALGITAEDVERSAQGIMRDLERTCSCCGEKGTCRQDLANRPDDPKWQRYCPNSTSLASLVEAKGKSTA
jgi:hypothetical protein